MWYFFRENDEEARELFHPELLELDDIGDFVSEAQEGHKIIVQSFMHNMYSQDGYDMKAKIDRLISSMVQLTMDTRYKLRVIIVNL